MPESPSERPDDPPRIIRRIPAHLYVLLFGQIRYAFHTGLDSDFKNVDEQLLGLLTYQQPHNEFLAMQRSYNEWIARLREREEHLDELIRRLILRCIELNIATDAEIAQVEQARAADSGSEGNAEEASA